MFFGARQTCSVLADPFLSKGDTCNYDFEIIHHITIRAG